MNASLMKALAVSADRKAALMPWLFPPATVSAAAALSKEASSRVNVDFLKAVFGVSGRTVPLSQRDALGLHSASTSDVLLQALPSLPPPPAAQLSRSLDVLRGMRDKAKNLPPNVFWRIAVCDHSATMRSVASLRHMQRENAKVMARVAAGAAASGRDPLSRGNDHQGMGAADERHDGGAGGGPLMLTHCVVPFSSLFHSYVVAHCGVGPAALSSSSDLTDIGATIRDGLNEEAKVGASSRVIQYVDDYDAPISRYPDSCSVRAVLSRLDALDQARFLSRDPLLTDPRWLALQRADDGPATLELNAALLDLSLTWQRQATVRCASMLSHLVKAGDISAAVVVSTIDEETAALAARAGVGVARPERDRREGTAHHDLTIKRRSIESRLAAHQARAAGGGWRGGNSGVPTSLGGGGARGRTKS